MVDAAGTVMSVNPFGAEQLGYSVSELVGQPVLTVFYEPDRPKVQENLVTCLERMGRSMSWEMRKVRKDGAVIWVRETAKAVDRVDGPIVLIACEDVTAAKRSQQDLEKAFREIKVLKEQLHRENIALREEIGETSMFEETVGGSPLLKAVFGGVAQGSPTEFTVLITCENGAGEGMIARAIYKQFQSSTRPFLKVRRASKLLTSVTRLWTCSSRIRGRAIFGSCRMSLSARSLSATRKTFLWMKAGSFNFLLQVFASYWLKPGVVHSGSL